MVEVGGEPSPAAPQFAEGRFGQAMKFQGARILEIPLDITKEIYPQVTVTGWVYVDAENDNQQTGTLVSNNSFLNLQLYGGQFWMTTGRNTMVQYTTEVVPKHRWVFFAGVWDTSTNQATAYIDQRTKSGDMTLDTARDPDRSVWVGAQKVSSGSILKGVRIDDLRIYPGALSPAQIRDVWSGSGAPETESAAPESSSSTETASTIPEGFGPASTEDIGTVADSGPVDGPISGTTEIEEALAEGELSYDPSATPGIAGDIETNGGPEANPDERQVTGWQISATDTYTTDVAGFTDDESVVRTLELNSRDTGISKIGWAADKNVPCRLKVSDLMGGNAYRLEAGTCRYVTGTKGADLSFGLITKLTVETKYMPYAGIRRVDMVRVTGHLISDDGEFGKEVTDRTWDQATLPGNESFDGVECRSGYVATGVVGHFHRRPTNDTVLMGLQLKCSKIVKLYG